VKRNPPLDVRAPHGLTVKTLMKLLATANPDAKVMFGHGVDGWGKVRKASLDASPSTAGKVTPWVVLT
jgi:hypothetical protein